MSIAVPIVLLSILSAYTAIWAAINVYNVYPLIAYNLNRRFGRRYAKYRLPDKLPTISILVPAYHEGNVLEHSVKSIFKADYPADLIDVIILTESDDHTTTKIAKQLVKDCGTRHVHIEETEEPRGKPRALNVGLRHVRGEIVGVVDAEDIIARRLFKEVVAMIYSGFDAVQGVLDMTNDRDGFKNMHLRAEYRYWYKTYIPALVYSNFPVPLGGTTNFFKRSILHELNGWDPYNLTEDFDLGIRLYNEHKKIGAVYDMLKGRESRSLFHNKYELGLMKSVTKEESPITWIGWLKQRTRWQRGKIQTLRKVMKKPPERSEQKAHSIAMSLVPHLGLINITGIAFSVYVLFSRIVLPAWIYYIFYFNLAMILFYSVMQGKSYFDVVHKNRKHKLRNAVFIGLTTPAYWFLQWIADLRAIKQEYVDRRIFWEKTEHVGVNMKRS